MLKQIGVGLDGLLKKIEQMVFRKNEKQGGHSYPPNCVGNGPIWYTASTPIKFILKLAEACMCLDSLTSIFKNFYKWYFMKTASRHT